MATMRSASRTTIPFRADRERILTPSPSIRAAAPLVLMLIATTALSQFFRASTTVIAPELIRDLGLSASMLGFANAAFFLALLAIQIPVGLMFDRIGARLTVTILAAAAVAGSLMHWKVTDGSTLSIARALTGIGHGGSFMGTVFLISRWYPRMRWATALSWVFSSSMIGIVAAGMPLAVLAEKIGWRGAFVGVAAIQALVGILFWMFVRDDPPGRTPEPRRRESLMEALRGFPAVLALPGLGRVMALQLVAYAVLVTMLGLWAGPYLHDVHGLDPIERGSVLTAMALAQFLGVLAVGPLDRLFDTRKWVAVAGAIATIGTMLALAAVPQPPKPMAITLLVLLCAVSTYGIVVVAHGRSFFPEALAGRGATTFNAAQLIGCALMPMLTGLVPGLFATAGPGYSPVAYQWVFVSIAATLTLGLAVYLTSKDIRPSGKP